MIIEDSGIQKRYSLSLLMMINLMQYLKLLKIINSGLSQMDVMMATTNGLKEIISLLIKVYLID